MVVGEIEVVDFADPDAWDRWLAEHGPSRSAVWLKIAKKGTGPAGITAAEAGDVAIAHGWIDGHRRGLDGSHFLQRYSPRRPGSPWSRVNVERVEALEAAGHGPVRALQRMTAANLGPHDAALLGLEPGAAALSILRLCFDASGEAIELTRSLYRGDAYDFVAELTI